MTNRAFNGIIFGNALGQSVSGDVQYQLLSSGEFSLALRAHVVRLVQGQLRIVLEFMNV